MDSRKDGNGTMGSGQGRGSLSGAPSPAVLGVGAKLQEIMNDYMRMSEENTQLKTEREELLQKVSSLEAQLQREGQHRRKLEGGLSKLKGWILTGLAKQMEGKLQELELDVDVDGHHDHHDDDEGGENDMDGGHKAGSSSLAASKNDQGQDMYGSKEKDANNSAPPSVPGTVKRKLDFGGGGGHAAPGSDHLKKRTRASEESTSLAQAGVDKGLTPEVPDSAPESLRDGGNGSQSGLDLGHGHGVNEFMHVLNRTVSENPDGAGLILNEGIQPFILDSSQKSPMTPQLGKKGSEICIESVSKTVAESGTKGDGVKVKGSSSKSKAGKKNFSKSLGGAAPPRDIKEGEVIPNSKGSKVKVIPSGTAEVGDGDGNYSGEQVPVSRSNSGVLLGTATGLARKRYPEKIVGTEFVDKKLNFLIKWSGSQDPELVPVKEATTLYPKLVYEFNWGERDERSDQ